MMVTSLHRSQFIGWLAVLFLSVLVTLIALYFIAYVQQPVDISERYRETPFDVSLTLQNVGDEPFNVDGFTLNGGGVIELRTLADKAFLRWSNSVRKNGHPIKPRNTLKIENSIYGKYSIELTHIDLGTALAAPITDSPCQASLVDWINPIPMTGGVLRLRNEEETSFYQSAYYSDKPDLNVHPVILEENLKRQSSKGNHFYTRYSCASQVQKDRLRAFLEVIDALSE